MLINQPAGKELWWGVWGRWGAVFGLETEILKELRRTLATPPGRLGCEASNWFLFFDPVPQSSGEVLHLSPRQISFDYYLSCG